MFPLPPCAWVLTHLFETAATVVCQEIADHNPVHSVLPAAKHSSRRDVARAGTSPNLSNSSDDEDRSEKANRLSNDRSRREDFRHKDRRREDLRRCGSPDGSETSD